MSRTIAAGSHRSGAIRSSAIRLSSPRASASLFDMIGFPLGRHVLFATGLLLSTLTPQAREATSDGLVGWWTFDDGTGRDLSGQGNDMRLGESRVHPLGAGKACLRLDPDR